MPMASMRRRQALAAEIKITIVNHSYVAIIRASIHTLCTLSSLYNRHTYPPKNLFSHHQNNSSKQKQQSTISFSLFFSSSSLLFPYFLASFTSIPIKQQSFKSPATFNNKSQNAFHSFRSRLHCPSRLLRSRRPHRRP